MTLDGNLQWEKTADEGVFQTIVASYILRYKHKTHGNIYTIELYNSDNEMVDRFTDEELTDNDEYESELVFSKMSSAYDKARRQAMGTEKAIDDIISELDNNIPF